MLIEWADIHNKAEEVRSVSDHLKCHTLLKGLKILIADESMPSNLEVIPPDLPPTHDTLCKTERGLPIL